MLDVLEDYDTRILVIGPHPDDAEFSTGRLMLRRKGRNTQIICLTDGRKGQEGTDLNKIFSEKEYIQIRENESRKALSELGIKAPVFLGLPDQELINNPYIIDKIALLIRKISPEYILIPPYEGAHPDHDAAHLFSVIACRNIGFSNIIEYSSYNNYQGRFTIQRFIPKNTEEYTLVPTPNEQKRWLSIMKIFKSQKNQQMHYIPKSRFEMYRLLPEYDYSELPYSNSENIRELLAPLYPLTRKILPAKEKLFYETWKADIDPVKVKKKLQHYITHYLR